MLKFVVKMGIKVAKVHRIIKFKQDIFIKEARSKLELRSRKIYLSYLKILCLVKVVKNQYGI